MLYSLCERGRHHVFRNSRVVLAASSILFWGTFGSKTPAERRYHVTCILALVLMIAAMRYAPAWATHIAPGIAFSAIAWEFRRYLLSLDELARRMQMEAITWTYLTGLPVAMFLFFWTLSPAWFIILELVRAGWLYAISRKY